MSNISEILNKSKFIDILNIAGAIGKDMNINTYVVGGYIRDALLNRENSSGNNLIYITEI